MEMRPLHNYLSKLPLILIFSNLFTFITLSVSDASDLKTVRTPSTGYQSQFQVSGNKIYYVWHEDHGQTEPIWIAEEELVK